MTRPIHAFAFLAALLTGCQSTGADSVMEVAPWDRIPSMWEMHSSGVPAAVQLATISGVKTGP